MLAIGRHHLAWGSADQHPLAPALAALADTAVPGSVVALRLPVILATTGAVVVAALIARELGCDRRAKGFVAAAQATAVWSALAGHWLTPYSLESVQWLLVVWLLVRWIRVRDDRLLLAAGVAVGIAALTRFQIALLCVALLVSVAAAGPRELLRRPMLWWGAGVALALAAPTVWWQAAHGWPQLRMAPVVAGEAEALYGGRPGIAVQLLAYAGVAGLALVLYGIWQLRDPRWRPYRFLGVAFVVLFVLFVATAGRPYYLAGLYAPLAAVGARALQHRRVGSSRRRGWLVWPAWAVSAAPAVAAIALSVVVVQDETGEGIAAGAADAYHRLPERQRERTALIGESYIVAASADGYASRYDLPRAFSTNRSYGYFSPPPEDNDAALFVGRDPGLLSPYFADTRAVAEISDEIAAYLMTGRRQPWEDIWAQTRTLTVT
ncbi:glycosyltransferase family 39 protein [Mycolicibacterium phlei]|jgi:4-amino-4-deoxy-L-arabinose transferase-like glycosyltransferase